MRDVVNVNAERKKDLARRLGRAVEVVYFLPGNICVDVHLDKETLSFAAHVNDEEFRNKDGALVKKWAYDKLKAMCDLKWEPLILVINTSEAGSHSWGGRNLKLHAISLDVNRVYAAELPGGDIRFVDWEVPDDKRLTSQKSPYAWVSRAHKAGFSAFSDLPIHDDDTHIMAYSEPLWNAINAVATGIDSLSAKLSELMSSKEGVARLIEAGTRMALLLGPPAEPKKRKELEDDED